MLKRSLKAHLANHAESPAPYAAEVAEIVALIAEAGITIASTVAEGANLGALADQVGAANSDGDNQRGLDLLADERFLAAISHSPVGLYASEEIAEPVQIGSGRPLALAIDPLDGSSNIDTNVSIGTIFSIRPILGDPATDPRGSFLQSGRGQIAAGFLIYGPQTALVLTLGTGTAIFILSHAEGEFLLAVPAVQIPTETREFAINASNYRHWGEAVGQYIDDCLSGVQGPREKNFNMRWIASLVAECYRIMIRGGVFLYPGDNRNGYTHGRLRLVYEAHPIAMLIEQAGGLATDCVEPILDIAATDLHQRTPLVFGSSAEVMAVARYHAMPGEITEREPLSGRREQFSN